MAENSLKIPRRILGNLLNSAAAGVVPRQGLEYLAIGREKEISAINRDLDNLSLGMGAFRFIVGKYGSGKSFLIGLTRSHAQERGFVTADTDLSPERRFQGTSGQGLATFRSLMQNLSTKAMPDGNALPAILTAWFTGLERRGITEDNLALRSAELEKYVQKEIFRVSEKLRGYVFGFDFAKALAAYYEGYRRDNDALIEDALRWLRGEFSGKTQSRASEVHLSSVIDDCNWFEFLKLYSVFFREIGYEGLVVFFDECVNLYKIPNRISRENNYEKILSMFNDTMQGKAEGLGVYLGATPQLVSDTRRGLFSYEALRSRLVPGRFADSTRRNLLSPLIELERLSDDEIFALCKRLVLLHASYYGYAPTISDEKILAFLQAALNKMGADELITPREVTRDFLNVLDVLFTDPEATFEDLFKTSLFEPAVTGEQDKTDAENGDFFGVGAWKL